jgi:hypothetical protein
MFTLRYDDLDSNIHGQKLKIEHVCHEEMLAVHNLTLLESERT